MRQFKGPAAEAELNDKFGRGEITLEEYKSGINVLTNIAKKEMMKCEGKP